MLRASRRRVRSFSLASRRWRAASHSSRFRAILGRLMGLLLSPAAADISDVPHVDGRQPRIRRSWGYGRRRARIWGMTERRVPWDVEAYVARARSACFVCELLAGAAGYEHHVIHRDDVSVVFLAKYPSLRGHVLVAPVDHREHVVGDFSADEYVALQRIVHLAGAALTAVVETERLYVVSLGSQQGNRHVHWHLLPLPPGVPYGEQQAHVFDEGNGWVQLDERELAALARDIGAAMADGNTVGTAD